MNAIVLTALLRAILTATIGDINTLMHSANCLQTSTVIDSMTCSSQARRSGSIASKLDGAGASSEAEIHEKIDSLKKCKC